MRTPTTNKPIADWVRSYLAEDGCNVNGTKWKAAWVMEWNFPSWCFHPTKPNNVKATALEAMNCQINASASLLTDYAPVFVFVNVDINTDIC